MGFSERLSLAVLATGSVLCVGVDPHPEGLAGSGPGAARAFGERVIAACAGRVPAVKIQAAFFEALGPAGMEVMAGLCVRAREAGLLVIMDAKRGDIASTAAAYARAYFGAGAPFESDALTVSPYLGPDSVAPFVAAARAAGGGVFVLVRTSNPGAEAWQARIAAEVAAEVERCAGEGAQAGGYGDVGAVVGATWPEQIAAFRAMMPRAWMLLPGFGAQGGTAAGVRGAFDRRGLGGLVVGARGLTFPDEGEGAIRARIAAAQEQLWAAGIRPGEGA